jgi:hypothetical protein
MNFDNLQKLNKSDFNFISINWIEIKGGKEPLDGTIFVKLVSSLYYFNYSHHYDQGATYIVYRQDKTPVYYFMIETGENEDYSKYHVDDI